MIGDTIGNITAAIKRSVSDHAFLAIELYDALSALQSRWDDCWSTCLKRSGGASTDAQQVQNVFIGHIATLRSVALRAFPELLVDIKTASASSEATSSIADVTHSTIRYLERLPRYEELISKLLQTLGERNWLMGASEPPSAAKLSSEGGILNLYVGMSR
jgi:exocyst complex protein 7